MQNRNKLRKGNNKAIWIQMGIVFTLIILGFMLYATYVYLCYIQDNSIEEIDFNVILSIAESLASPSFSIPITLELIGKLFFYQAVHLWYVYAGFAVIIFLIATGRQHNDYRGIEKGSASWEEKYSLKEFRDKTGIPQAYNFYATVGNPKGKSYKPHNLNEMVIGGSGAGKSFRKIKPDIIQMYGSYVVTDPKVLVL